MALLSAVCPSHASCDLEPLLQRLDSIVADSRKYDQQKEAEILALKRSDRSINTPRDLYGFYRHLHAEYVKFNPDSAIAYARRCQDVARAAGLDMELTQARIDEAYVMVISGQMYNAGDIISQLDPIDRMPQSLKPAMAVLLIEYIMRNEILTFGQKTTVRMEDVWAKYSRYIPRDNWLYAYYTVLVGKRGSLQQLQKLYRTVRQPSKEAAMLAVAIAKSYYLQGDCDNYLRYLIISAENDIRSANHEASSLLYLVKSPYIKLCPSRAFNYLMLCTGNAKVFKDQRRALEIVEVSAGVISSYQQQLKQRNFHLCLIIALLVVAVVVIGLLLMQISKKRKLQAETLKKLKEANISMEGMVDNEKKMQEQLQAANGALKKELAYHNQNFFDVYNLVAKYIADMQEFKKTVFNLVTAGKYDKARRELGNNAQTEKYLKNFFTHFDKAFLLSHPDFLERFNRLLRPECQMQMPAPDTLTPELRIYALVSIGVTDSVSIAQFLHYSPQTVYNYRLKVRHAACIPEKCFAETVERMYREA